MGGWWDRAACRGGGVEFFGGHSVKNAEAKVVCAGCPVRVACLVDQLRWERVYPQGSHLAGVFGGLSGLERERLLSGGRAGWVVAV